MNGWTLVAGVCAACALLGWIEAFRIHRRDERRLTDAQDDRQSSIDVEAAIREQWHEALHERDTCQHHAQTLHDYALMAQEHHIAPLAYECYLLEWQASHAQEHFEEDSTQLHALVDELHALREERDALKTALDKEIRLSASLPAPVEQVSETVTPPHTATKGVVPKRPRATLKSRASDMAAGSDGGGR